MSLAELLRHTPRELRDGPLEPVEVAIVDSGIDATHPALQGRIAEAWAITTGPGGVIRTPLPVPSNQDVFGHGTSVAGIVAAIAPNAKLVDIRVLDNSNVASGDTVVEGLRLAIERGIRVINLSIACKARMAPMLSELCEEAYRKNLLVVAAKRNMPLVDNGFPAELSATVSVDLGDFPSPFDLRYRPGDAIEFIGHGVDVPTWYRGGGAGKVTGTSFATPTISGLCALIAGAAPALRPFEVKTVLKHHARPDGAGPTAPQ